jgi:hypothetical protein
VLQLSLEDMDWIELGRNRIQWLVPMKATKGIGCRKPLELFRN